jgi:hypothetical protein
VSDSVLDPFARARKTARHDTAQSLEIARIVSLPIVELPTDEEVEEFCRCEVQAEYFEGKDGERPFRLFNTQVGGVLAWDMYKGLFGCIGVGWGKTLITLMIANRAYESGDSQRSLLLVPSQVYAQLTQRDIPWARKRVGLRVPFVLMGGRDAASRASAAKSQKRGCYVAPYSHLSTKDAEAVLHGIAPDLLILDEAHKVKNAKAARTARVMRYLRARQPRVVALSGTITSKSISDYHHLLTFSLGERSPLPLEGALALNWSYVLDANADPSDAQTGPIAPLIDWARKEFPAEKLPKGVPGFRKAYRLRLNTSPGVVATGDNEIGVSLTIQNKPVDMSVVDDKPEMVRLRKLMQDVEELWRTPSGDEIEWGFQKWRYLYELTSGLYNNLRWPTTDELMLRGRLSRDQAVEHLMLAKMHHEALQEYHKKLRRWIERAGRAKLDTPFLIAANMANHGAEDVGEELYEAWCGAKDLEFDGMPSRLSEPIRVCDYKIQHAVAWARELSERKPAEGGLIWFKHDESGRWLAEELQRQGLGAIWAPAESVRKGMNELVDYKPGETRTLVISMGGHGEGKNLQHEFYNQLFLDFPRDASLAEQVLGRTHRNGQKADELVAHTMNTLQFDHLNMAACLVDALYNHQTTGSRQKLIYCSHDPLPKVYPLDFLRERGFVDVAQLDAEARAALEEKFGPMTRS